MVVRKIKEKCKESARMRREKERAEFHELSRLLPLPSSITNQLDKASIIRLTSSYLRMRSAFPQGLGVNWGCANRGLEFTKQIRELGSLILQTLDGFVLALHRDGKIMYISETASVHLGLPQIDLTGSSIYEYVHPSDHEDLNKILTLSDADQQKLATATIINDEHSFHQRTELDRSFCMRMRCVLPKRNAGLISGGFKAMHCNGYLKAVRPLVSNKQEGSLEDKWASYALVAVGHPLLPAASTEVKITGKSFMFRSNLDLKLHYIEENITNLLGFTQREMIGRSLYQFVHVSDAASLESSHRTLLDKGQTITRYYRLMKKEGGFVWVQSHATLVSSPRAMPKPQQIVVVCQFIAESDSDESVILNQQEVKQEKLDSHHRQVVQPAFDDRVSPSNHSELNESAHVKTPVLGPTIRSGQQKLHRGQSTVNAPKKSRKIKLSPSIQLISSAAKDFRTDYHLCTWKNYNESSPTPILVRRTSDDSSSVVSSIASTSISSIGSSASSQSSETYLGLTVASNGATAKNSCQSTNQFCSDNHLKNSYLGEPMPYEEHRNTNILDLQATSFHQQSVSPILMKDSAPDTSWFGPGNYTQQHFSTEDQMNTYYLDANPSQPGLFTQQPTANCISYNSSSDPRQDQNYYCFGEQREGVVTFYQDHLPQRMIDPSGQFLHPNCNNFYPNSMYSV